MSATLFGIPLVLIGFICIGIAIIYAFIWPRPNPADPPRPAARAFILRWGHALVWVLLALACFVVGQDTALLAGALGIAALLLYILFIATIFVDRQAADKATRAAGAPAADSSEQSSSQS